MNNKEKRTTKEVAISIAVLIGALLLLAIILRPVLKA